MRWNVLKRIGTHSGTFHCDEVMACYLLRVTKEYQHSEIVRTRNPEVLNKLDCLVDVGGVYDPPTHRFDHHQSSFEEFFGGEFNYIKLSSAGLIWKHFGIEVLRNTTSVKDPLELETLHKGLYSYLFQAIDAKDNGISPFPPNQTEKYRDNTCLPSRISRMNVHWNSLVDDSDERFNKALNVVGEEFQSILGFFESQWLASRSIVHQAILEAPSVHRSGLILKLSKHCPWKEHLHELEGTQKFFYVVYPDRDSGWRVQAVPRKQIPFASRVALPAEWRGKNGEALAEVSGVPDAVFVHNTGFIGGAGTYEGALALAEYSLMLRQIGFKHQ